MKINKNVYIIIALAVFTFTAVSPVFAETTNPINQQNNGGMHNNRGNNKGMMRPSVIGTVSAINGNSITLNGKQGFGTNAVNTTFTIDATNAKFTKNNTASNISNIIVGDTIAAQGTLTGTNLVATNIRDGIMRGNNNQNRINNGIGQNNPLITGNGLPVVAGTVTSINGNTFIITNKSNVSYTIDATNAKITQGQNTILATNITVGDMVIIQGTVNGNNVTATSVNDQVKPASSPSNTTTPAHKSFFSGIGSFFSHMFGF